MFLILLFACADSRGKQPYIEGLENNRYALTIQQGYQSGNLVTMTDQNGTTRSVALKDTNGDGIADGIDLDSDGNLDIRLLHGNELRFSPYAFTVPIDINNDGIADYYLYFNIVNNVVSIKFLSRADAALPPLVFLINSSNLITGLDTNSDLISDDTRLDGKVVVSAGSAPDTTPPSQPGTPGGVTGGTTQIDLAWTAATDDTSAAGAISYEICQSLAAGGCSTFSATYTVPAGQMNYSATGLSALTTYYYAIRSRDASGNYGAPSSEFSAPTAAAGTVNNPTYSPVTGVYGVAQDVTISTTTLGASICYTTDGVTTPACDGAGLCTVGSTYLSLVNTAVTTHFQALACLSGNTASAVVSASIAIGVDTWDDTTRPKVLISSALVKPDINLSWGPLASAVKYRVYGWSGVWNYHSETTLTTYTYTDTTQWMRVCAQNVSLVDYHCSVYAPPQFHATASVTWISSLTDFFSDSIVGTNYFLKNPGQHAESNGYLQLNQNVTDDGSGLFTYYQDAGKRYTRIHFKKYFHRNGNNFMGDFTIADYANSGNLVTVSMYYTDFDAKYGLNFREYIFDKQNLTPTNYAWTTLDATQRFDQWLDYEIIIDKVGKTARISQNGVYYNKSFNIDFSGDFILSHTPYGWNTGHFVRIDDYEVESSDTNFPTYPLGNQLLADVSYFGEHYTAAANYNTFNWSHAANLIISMSGQMHFAHSDNGAVNYRTSLDNGQSWVSNNPNSLRANKASNVSLGVANDDKPILVAQHDAFDFDANQGTDNPGNYSRELFEATFDGATWSYQGIKRYWNWTGDTYGYVQGLCNQPASYVLQSLVLSSSGDFNLQVEECGWYTYGHVMREITRSGGAWDTIYAAQVFTGDGQIISGETSAWPDANYQSPVAGFVAPNGTRYAFYNRQWQSSGVALCEFYYRTKPPAGSWGAATLIAQPARGYAAKLDAAGNLHTVYSGCTAPNAYTTEYVYYKKNLGSQETVSTESASFIIHDADLFIAPSGQVTVAWGLTNGTLSQFNEIRFNERTPEGIWGTAASLTTGFTGYGKNAPLFARGNRYDVFPRRRQLVYNENYNDGTDKKRIMLYTWPGF